MCGVWRQPVRSERERDRGHRGHVVPPGDRVGEEVRAERAQDEGRDERDVVPDQRLVRQRGDAAPRSGASPRRCSENARMPGAG